MPYKQGLLLENSKEPYKLKASKISNNARKASKTRTGDKFQIVLMMQKYAKMILIFGQLEKMLQSNSWKKWSGRIFIKSFEALFWVTLYHNC